MDNKTQLLLLAFMSIAPNEKVQVAMLTALTECQTEDEKLLHITSSLYNGLAYGNWIGCINDDLPVDAKVLNG